MQKIGQPYDLPKTAEICTVVLGDLSQSHLARILRLESMELPYKSCQTIHNFYHLCHELWKLSDTLGDTRHLRTLCFYPMASNTTSAATSADVEEATKILSQYVGKTLRVHTDDNRIFVGQMKCTDRVS